MSKDKEIIGFYSGDRNDYTGNEYAGNRDIACLSNYSKDPLIYGCRNYSTAEHAYQCQKPINRAHMSQIFGCLTPLDAMKMGTDKNLPIRQDWHSYRLHIMWEILLCKFTQRDFCKKALLETKDAYLEFRAPTDSFWGTGSANAGGTGKNNLGKMLMEIRSILCKYDITRLTEQQLTSKRNLISVIKPLEAVETEKDVKYYLKHGLNTVKNDDTNEQDNDSGTAVDEDENE